VRKSFFINKSQEIPLEYSRRKEDCKKMKMKRVEGRRQRVERIFINIPL